MMSAAAESFVWPAVSTMARSAPAPGVGIATHNDVRPDAQQMPISGAHYLRRKRASAAQWLAETEPTIGETDAHVWTTPGVQEGNCGI